MNWLRKRKLLKLQVELTGQKSKMEELRICAPIGSAAAVFERDKIVTTAQRIGELQASISAVLCEDLT